MEISLSEIGLLSTLSIIIFSSLVRLIVINNGVRNLFFLPYPAALLLLGMFFGGITFTTPQLNEMGLLLEKVKHIPGLNMFLPAYIFKTIFLMDWQDFVKGWKQVFILGIVGFFGLVYLSGTLFAVLCGAPVAGAMRVILYGAVIGVMDPGDLFDGYSQLRQLRTLLQGEALVTTALAMLIYTSEENSNNREDNETAYGPFLLVALNIAVAVLLGKIFMLFLKYEKCDFNTYICISIAAGYLLFSAMEIFYSYGIVSLIVFAMMICPFRRGHDPEMNEALARFWTTIHHAANFLVCVMVGILFIRTLFTLDIWETIWKIVVLYLFVLASRSLMMLLLSPILERTGFGLCWRRGVVLVWGGLRCTISLGLLFCTFEKEYRSKFHVYGVGMVLLNQIVNGTTLRAVMLGLGLLAPTHVSSIDKVLRHLEEEKMLTAQALHNSTIFADAHWSSVEEATILKRSKFPRENSIEAEYLGVRFRQCEECRKLVTERLKPTELHDLEILARKKILKAQKVSYTRQHAQELLSTEAYQILCAAVEAAYHKPVPTIRTTYLHRYWRLGILQSKIYSCLVRSFPDYDPSITRSAGHWFLEMIKSVRWEWFVMLTVVTHGAYVFWDLMSDDDDISYASLALAASFTLLVSLQLLVQLFQLRWQSGWKAIGWTLLDFCVAVICVSHLLALVIHVDDVVAVFALSLLRLLRLSRLFRLVHLVRKTLPFLSRWLNHLISVRLLLGYDIGKGFILGNEEALKLLPRLVHNPSAMVTLQDELEMDRLEVYREIQLLHRYWPIPVASMKTRQCALSMVHRMQVRAMELSCAGLLDDEEVNHLLRELAEQRRQLKTKLRVVAPKSTRDVLAQVSWLRGDSDALALLSSQAIAWTLGPGSMVQRAGDPPEGLLVICSGLLRCSYVPQLQQLQTLQEIGALPNVDFPRHLNYSEPQVEYAWEGTVLGEIGVLTGRNHDATVHCETNVVILFISMSALQPVISRLQIGMWKSVATRIATILLTVTPGFEAWTQERIKDRLEGGLLPDLAHAVSLDLGDLAQYLFVIEGVVADVETGNFFIAPCVIPSHIRRLHLPESRKKGFPSGAVLPRVMVLASRNWEDVKIKRTQDGGVALVADITWCPLHEPPSVVPS